MRKKKTLEHAAPYGGQAVIEGVMMRSPRFFAVACRKPNNEIVIRQEPVESYLKKFSWMNIPFLRGTLALIDTMMMGMKALSFSANVAMEETGPARGEPEKSQKINDIMVGGMMIIALAFGVGLFVVLPNVLTNLLKHVIHSHYWMNVVEGLVKAGIAVGYIAAISLMKDIRRVFQYHGAEHKVINAFEAGLELTPENINKHTTIHPRCGTAFLVIVIGLSIVVHIFLGWSGVWWERILGRIAVMPIIVGLAYEGIRLAGRFRHSRLLSLFFAPGLWLQRLTTKEPSEDQVEVALTALDAVVEAERAADAVPETITALPELTQEETGEGD